MSTPALIPPSTFNLQPSTSNLQPVANVAALLDTRRPQPDPKAERALFVTLPRMIREEVETKLDAFAMVRRRVAGGASVTRAIADVLPLFRRADWSHKRFRALYDQFNRERDWLVLVNRSLCPACWRDESRGLPPEFLQFCAQRFGQFKRDDGKRQALMAIKRQWRTGRNSAGVAETIPGYEKDWPKRVREIIPAGWSYSNILKQIKNSGLFTRGVEAFVHEGESAAREHLPQISSTRAELRFLELITFDDVRTDWLVFNSKTGAAEELWLLVARDQATAMVLGFVMHPASEREDGRCTHLGLAQMKQLAGWLLERYPLPPYVVTWKIERGTATLNEAMRLALGELLGNRIRLSYTSMIGGTSPDGYREKQKGNSRGKASHESHNRLFHTQGANLPGQTGRHYALRPADLNARTAEAVATWELANKLPAQLRGQAKYPLLTLPQARENLFRICNDQNCREDHKLEGFGEVVEWFDGERWQPSATMPSEAAVKGDVRIRKRMEMPIERAARLAAGLEWTPVSPDIVAAFYEHTQRTVVVQDNGEIVFEIEGRQLRYQRGNAPALLPATKALAYFHPDDPKFVHLTNGKGAFLGTWLRRDRVGFHDRDALADAMRYTHIAREAARAAADALAAPEREQLEAMRAHNAELMKLAEFTDVTEAPRSGEGTVGAPVGAALTTVSEAVKADRKAAEKREDKLRAFKGGTERFVEEETIPNPKTTAESKGEGFGVERLL